MVQYTCGLCTYTTHNKTDYSRHLSTKGHLEKVNNDTKSYIKHTSNIPETYIEKNIFKCPFCKNTYSNSSSLARHKKTCNAKKELIESK